MNNQIINRTRENILNDVFFLSQLEKAREATDAANIRAAYAEVVVAGLNEDTANQTKTVKLTQQTPDWESKIELPKDLTVDSNGNAVPQKDGSAVVTYSSTGVTVKY